MKINYEKFSDAMRMQRAKNRLSQQDVADKLNISYTTYAKYENDIRKATTEDFIFLLNMFELDINDFIMK